MKKIYFASDHAGYELKRFLMGEFSAEYDCCDCGGGPERCDYPDYAAALARAMQNEPDALGVVVCGSGLGISMAANRFAHVRAALCNCAELATLAREHNDANVLALGARFVAAPHAASILRAFLRAQFAGAQHTARVQKLGELR